MGRAAARQRPGEEPRRIHQRDCSSDPSPPAPPPLNQPHKSDNDNPQLSGTNQTWGNYGIQKLAESGIIPSSKWLEVWNVSLIVGPIDFPH